MSRKHKNKVPEQMPEVREICFYDDEDPKAFQIGYYVNYDFIRKSIAETVSVTTATNKDPIYLAAVFKGMIDAKLIEKLRELNTSDWKRGASKGSYYKEKMQELQTYKAIAEQQAADITKLKDDKKKLIAKVDAPLQAECDIDAIKEFIADFETNKYQTKEDLIVRIATRIKMSDNDMQLLRDKLYQDNN